MSDNGDDPRYNRNRREIYLDIQEKDMLLIPPPVRTPEERRNRKLWCEYHKECGHTTKDCRELKKALDKLADQGKINRYLRNPKRQEKDDARSHDTDGYVGVIAGGFASGGSSSRRKKAHLHSLKTSILHVEKPRRNPVMIFDDESARPIQAPHDDPLVIDMKIANCMVKRILVDSGSSADIAIKDCLSKLKYDTKDLQPISQPLIGFGLWEQLNSQSA